MIKKSKVLLLRPKVYKMVLLFIMLLPALKINAQGLQFSSNDSLMSKRTSYQVFKDDAPAFTDHLQINFDLSLWDNQHLGYILNITDKKGNSYSLSSIYNEGSYLNFNIDSRSNKITIPLTNALLKRRKWMRVMVDLDLKNNAVGIFINDKWYRATDFGFDRSITPKITFGKNDHYSDVPNMAIKNLSVSDGSKSYNFPLNEWSGRDVYADNGDVTGYVDNPGWLINESYFWKQKLARTFNDVAGLNFDAKNEQFFIFRSDSLLLYDAEHDNVTAKAFQNKLPVPLMLAKSIINPAENKCYVYEVLKSTQPGPSIASLDLATLKWDAVGHGTIAEQRHHHNIFYDKNNDSFYLFGGYGSFKYYNDFFKYDKIGDTWQKIKFTGDIINPRFFSGYSQADEHDDVYIFGGYGNQSGNQIVGGKHFYDLYRVNLTTHTIKKCWEIKPNEEDFVTANNLIVSKDKKYFYALCYPHERPKTNLRLYKFSIKDGSYQVVSGTIPVLSERIETDHNLFYNPKQDAFYCTTQEFSTPSQSTIKIWALSFPPVSEQAYLLAHQPKKQSYGLYKIIAAVVVALALMGGVSFIYLKNKKKKAALVLEDEDEEENIPVSKKDNEKRANAVYLLGEFTVYDKNKRDITYLFSPKIKQLFILVLLNSRGNSGVVSKKISTILWPDKEVAKTKNIRGVTINHLRNVISDIEGIELTFLNDTYSFIIGDAVFCDYFTVSDALKKAHSDQQVLEHYELVARGGLLQSILETWLDDFKQEYEETLMPIILPLVRRIYEEGDFKKALEMSRIVLNIDPFNDIAIKYKLKALRRTKGIEHAHKVYNEFAAEYKKSLGEEYPVHFDKICSNKTDQR